MRSRVRPSALAHLLSLPHVLLSTSSCLLQSPATASSLHLPLLPHSPCPPTPRRSPPPRHCPLPPLELFLQLGSPNLDPRLSSSRPTLIYRHLTPPSAPPPVSSAAVTSASVLCLGSTNPTVSPSYSFLTTAHHFQPGPVTCSSYYATVAG
jgi:hypothetical protein